MDAPDPGALARFYSELLGWEIAWLDTDDATLLPPDGVGYLGFQREENYVPPVWPAELDSQQMQLHLDFEVTDLAVAVEHARELGATDAEFQPQDNVRVMLDPDGHPFCLFRDDSPSGEDSPLDDRLAHNLGECGWRSPRRAREVRDDGESAMVLRRRTHSARAFAEDMGFEPMIGFIRNPLSRRAH